MAYIDWEIRGPKIAVCNCDYCCPCEFNGRPSRGVCEGAEAHLIERGHFGGLRLDGLVIGAAYRWPGPVHEGGGWAQGLIDRRATPEQVEALFQILGGKEQAPTTVFNIYGSTMAGEHDPIFAELDFDCDIAARRGRFSVDGQVRMEISPIRNPVTGQAHRARITLPEGFEFREAEVASGDLRVNTALSMDLAGTHAALWYAAYGPAGVLQHAA